MKNLTEKALLVNLRISQWTARKYDNKATQEVNKNHNSKDAGRFNKMLIAKEGLQEINKVVTKARTFHYDNTLPWSDNGERLLPVLNYFEYVGKIGELKSEFETVVNKFVASYPAMIEQAKIDLNGLFNEKDYPTAIQEKFLIKTVWGQISEAADIRVNVSDKELETIKKSIESEFSERLACAQRDIYTRVIDQLKHMHERLTTKEEGNKDAAFKNSLFDNVLDLVELLPRLNVTNDLFVTELCFELKSLYTDPQSVRESKTLRANKAKEVEAMLSKIDSFLKPQIV
jgi:hypothetical protein